MKPNPEPTPSQSAIGEAQSLDVAVRVAFLEAFARELVRDTGIGERRSEEPVVEIDLPENGYRPVNRMAGLR